MSSSTYLQGSSSDSAASPLVGHNASLTAQRLMTVVRQSIAFALIIIGLAVTVGWIGLLGWVLGLMLRIW